MPQHDQYIDPSGQTINVTLSSQSAWRWLLTIQRGEELPIVATIDTSGSFNSLTAFALAHMRVGEQMKRWAYAEAKSPNELLAHLTHYARQLLKMPEEAPR
jgi:hypothetical protein